MRPEKGPRGRYCRGLPLTKAIEATAFVSGVEIYLVRYVDGSLSWRDTDDTEVHDPCTDDLGDAVDSAVAAWGKYFWYAEGDCR